MQKPQEIIPICARDKITMGDVAAFDTYEVGSELVLRLPRAQRNIAEFLAAPKEETRGLDSSGCQASIATDAVL